MKKPEENKPQLEKKSKLESDDRSQNVSNLKRSLLIAKELRIVKGIVSNDLKERSAQLKKLRKWISWRSSQKYFEFSENDFVRIWNGLFYYVWLSDKAIPQEEAAEKISSLLNDFNSTSMSIQFFSSFLQMMCRKWIGIDQWRMDKFQMLFRRMLRGILRVLQADDWTSTGIMEFNKIILSFLMSEASPNGLVMHFFDIFLEEFAKVSKGKASAETLNELLEPFFKYIEPKRDLKMIRYCCKRIFSLLIFHIKLGAEGSEDNEPESDVDLNDAESDEQTERIANDDNEDPRAAGVDAIVPLLQVDLKHIIEKVTGSVQNCVENNKHRKFLNNLLQRCLSIQAGSCNQQLPEKEESLQNTKRNTNATRNNLKSRKRKNALKHEVVGKNVAGKRSKKRSSGVWIEEEIK